MHEPRSTEHGLLRDAPRRILVYGHGDESDANRINTLASFAQARSAGADGVELDLRRTADDQLVVIHDPQLPDGRRIEATPRAELPEDIPLLEDVLDLCLGMRVNLEIKNYPRDPAFDASQRVTALTLDLLERRGFSDQVIVSCFDFGCIDHVRARNAQQSTAMLYLSRRDPALLLDAVVRHGHSSVYPYDTMVDANFMRLAQARGLEVNVWLEVAEEQRLRELVALNVDGLITSEIALAQRVARESNAST